ncbi:hypothetical protein WL77_05445 [Burkholderia ubonensis]|uniref:hypothetical protein n=1 Tax=Burkholderia ubonensis TaxID=101571 RepID=UPI000754F75D|nr:hypothetical protein [Burkholderia ubonensis]KVG23087.1 hypothetical protein WJ29_09740 [Burkholderia ubonensis]KVU79037.1 hypothetical protein WK72_29285 [Burkholderia ubonensis]KWB50575.1 hypothetical protein WL36_06235 [Burkholderia ubonensis]KWE65058.1 hypothetical protein WL79_30910 [Burkholderia ubonensis]KWE75366.1 hypothetical protein WL77_05445 [Burkholderia ubonensis]
MSSNIEKFDLLVAKLLANLYERFPIEAAITANAYGIDAENIFCGDTIDTAISAELDFFCGTVRWLNRAGYIDYSSEHDSGAFANVVLTAKALEILKATPESLSASQSIGDYLVDSVRGGTTDAVKQGVTAALSAGALFIWNALAK